MNIKVDEEEDELKSNRPGGFSKVPTDYYYRTLSLAIFDDHQTVEQTGFCRLCVGPTHETKFLLNWVYNFVNFSNSNTTEHQSPRIPFFAYGFFAWITHSDPNEAPYADHFFDVFFSQLLDSNLLRRTVVILFSDHGTRYGISRGATRISWYEENLPLVLIATPPEFRKKHPKLMSTLKFNADRLTTAFDLHETIRRIRTIGRSSYNDEERKAAGRRGVSLFDVAIGDRSCEDASIAPTYCECELSATVEVSVDDTQVFDVANKTVTSMNNQLQTSYKGLCSILRLQSIVEARVTNQTAATNRRIYYTLTFKTEPGEGLFQAMVERLKSGMVMILGDVLRLSPYAAHAGCINHIQHKKWCDCVDRKAGNKTSD
jgi:hypothetical protein